MQTITLSSDFGHPYPAAMKGVILRRTDARLVDVSHRFPRHDVRAAAFWLREVLPWFPPAVHLVVVDPGVGTDRRALAVEAGDHALVGPDNGVLVPAARELAAQSADDREPREPDVYAVDQSDARSSTFHGRDVFAPVAAAVHAMGFGAFVEGDRATPLDEWVDLRLPEATVEDERATGEVLVVDDFGNAITNVPGSFLSGADHAEVNGATVPVAETFDAVPAGDRLVTVGSHGYVECDVNRGRGDRAFGLSPGDEVRLEAW